MDRGFPNDIGIVFLHFATQGSNLKFVSCTITNFFYMKVCDKNSEAAQPRGWDFSL